MSNEHEHPDSAPATKGDILQDAEDDNIPQADPLQPTGSDDKQEPIGALAQASAWCPVIAEAAEEAPLEQCSPAPSQSQAHAPAEETIEQVECSVGDAPPRLHDLFHQPPDDVARSEPVDLKDHVFDDLVINLDEDFDKVLEADEARQSAAFAEIVQRTVARTPFSGFLATVNETRAPFSLTLKGVEPSILHQLVNAILPGKPTRQSLLRLILTETRLTVQANEIISVLEHRIDLPNGTGVEAGTTAAFYISAWDFDKAFRAAADEVSLCWTEGDALNFKSGSFEREIALRPKQQFTPFKQDAYSQASGGELSLAAVRDALQYARPLIDEFSKKATEPAIIELLPDGTFCAGAPNAMSVTRDPKLSGCEFSLRGNHVKALDAGLKVLQEPVQIFSDGRHCILWDGATALGWDRSIRGLGEAYAQLEALELGPQILISRNELAYSIAHLENLSGANNLQVHMQGAGKLDVKLSAESQTRRANRRIEGATQHVVPPDRMTLPIWPLLSALRGCKSPGAALRRSGPWMVVDDRDGSQQGACFYIAGSIGKR